MLHPVLQLTNWAEMELHITTSEHEALTPSFQHTALLQTRRTSVPLIEAAACGSSAPVTTFLRWKRSVVLTFCSHPLRCSTFPQSVWSGVLWCGETPPDRAYYGRQLMLPVLFSRPLQSSPLKVEHKVLPLLGRGTMMIMTEYFFLFFFFFFPSPSLILAICTGNLIQWSAGFVWKPKPTLWRWMCSLKPT